MEKSTTLNLRVNPDVKSKAETILNQLGIPMSTAINMYLNQITLTGGIPFSVALPKAPENINGDSMTNDEIHEKLQKGIEQAKNGNTFDAVDLEIRLK